MILIGSDVCIVPLSLVAFRALFSNKDTTYPPLPLNVVASPLSQVGFDIWGRV
jgi:hypothetical protein